MKIHTSWRCNKCNSELIQVSINKKCLQCDGNYELFMLDKYGNWINGEQIKWETAYEIFRSR